MVGVNPDKTMDIGEPDRIQQLVMVIITSILGGFLVNQITGLLDSIGRGEFNYLPAYLISVMGFFIFILILFWRLDESFRHIRVRAITQALIDYKIGEIPFIDYIDNDGSVHYYKPQIHLANAFVLLKTSLQLIATEEKHGVRTWMSPPIDFEKSEREERIRNKITEFYTNANDSSENPVYELFDQSLTGHLQSVMYVAQSYGIEEKEYIFTHHWRDNRMGGFNARPSTEDDPKRVPRELLPEGIVGIEPLFSANHDSREFRVRIPTGMKIKDISSNKLRGYRISGRDIDLEVTYKSIRHKPLEDLGLITVTEPGLIAEQVQLNFHLKMTILGYLRNRDSYERTVRWAKDYIIKINSEFDWPTFQSMNQICQIRRHVFNLEEFRVDFETKSTDKVTDED